MSTDSLKRSPYLSNSDNRRLLGLYVYYRLFISTLLCSLFLSGIGESILGTSRPDVFMNTSLLYVGMCSLSLLLYWVLRLKTYSGHLLVLLVIDFVALVVMIYASGGVSGGLGYLLLIPMAIGSIFLQWQANIGLAAFGTILVIAISLLNALNNDSSNQSIFAAGTTGVLLFVTAISFRLLSKKIQSSQHAVEQQTEHANYLQRLGQRIVETMHTGIVVVDKDLNIQLMNNSAKTLLTQKGEFHSIKQIRAADKALTKWQEDGVIPQNLTVNLGVNHSIKISFANLSDDTLTSIMLFIEDTRRMNQEAQQLKLASLGRLTASIAHEIRNPLGAISHASQLLDESDHIRTDDQQLLAMIQTHSQRINQIIDNILQFSRRRNATPEIVNINYWLKKFCKDYLEHKKAILSVKISKREVYCKIDPSHLYQIITNLVDNGVRHSPQNPTGSGVVLIADIDSKTRLPYIDVLDDGPGISEEKINEIFEPFYTTEVTGSGLGLYLCKELCQANQADILYFKKTAKQKSCFRLILCHPQRKI